jgi:hypothetical protein
MIPAVTKPRTIEIHDTASSQDIIYIHPPITPLFWLIDPPRPCRIKKSRKALGSPALALETSRRISIPCTMNG